jgi:hypothetical protein
MNTLSELSNAATAIGVGIAAFQIWQGSRQALTTFEDSFAKEYRDLAATLPAEALLGAELTIAEREKYFDEFYHYFDLSNEQIFLRQNRRVRRQTWIFWRDGIRSNFERPAFKHAWEKIDKRAPNDFSELRRLLRTEFKEDPINWSRCCF